jgi:hypothetical protein
MIDETSTIVRVSRPNLPAFMRVLVEPVGYLESITLLQNVLTIRLAPTPIIDAAIWTHG